MPVASNIPPLRKLVQGPSRRIVCFKEAGVSADGSVNTSTVTRAGPVSAQVRRSVSHDNDAI
jgi:hypothetical protein